MEESLNKLVNYVEPGVQNLIVMTGRGSRLQTSFNPPLEYDSTNVGYEMCLIRLETYFSFPNINKNNNAMRVSINGKWYDIKIPTGCYDIDSINTVLQRQLTKLTGEKKTEQHVFLSANKNTCVVFWKSRIRKPWWTLMLITVSEMFSVSKRSSTGQVGDMKVKIWSIS